MIPRVKSVGYLYLSVWSVFLSMFCNVLDTSGIEDAIPIPIKRGTANEEQRIAKECSKRKAEIHAMKRLFKGACGR